VSRETGREWIVFSYEALFVNPDDLYRENFVLSDLPAGEYFISAAIAETTISGTAVVRPGLTTFLQMHNSDGFLLEPAVLQPATLIAYVTPTPTVTFTPTLTATPTASSTQAPATASPSLDDASATP
jgi:hypothetical protein